MLKMKKSRLFCQNDEQEQFVIIISKDIFRRILASEGSISG